MPVALGAGGVLISARSIGRLQRTLGVGLIGAALLVSHNAYADETVGRFLSRQRADPG